MRRAAVDVVIAVPARNERQRIGACLTAVRSAVRTARTRGAVDRVTVAVGAHRCTDETASVARRALSVAERTEGISTVLAEYGDAAPVGAIRSRLVARALAPGPLRSRWIFSTDADTVVPTDWLTTGLDLAATTGCVMIVGLVDLDPRELDPETLAAHDRLVEAGISPDGSHDHVYAANLAVRADAYRELGGFPAVPVGEERALLDAARALGRPVLATTRWRVRTSGRTAPRAHGGLGDLLQRLTLERSRTG